MYSRYDQDLTPFFERMLAQRAARRRARRRGYLRAWVQLQHALGLRRKPARQP